MTYHLYRITPTGSSLEYTAVRKVKLAGNGLIQEACGKYLAGKDGGWTVSSSELVQAAGVSAHEHRLVIDTSPSRESINLYEIRFIIGYSYVDWTPIMICLQSLFCDEEDSLVAPDGSVMTTSAFKQRFFDTRCPRDIVRTVLYLRGGHTEGEWNWGGNGRTAGALLWNDAWSYFTKVLGK